MRPKRRVGVAHAVGGLAALVLLAGCPDAPDRAALPVDTAALQDRRIFEGEIGRDTGALSGDSLGVDTLAARPGEPGEPTLVLAADSAIGFRLFHRSAGCIACHGADARGLENLGPSLRDDVWLHIDGSLGAIEEVIRTGIARQREAAIAMPGLASRLDAVETYRVAAYVYSLTHPASVVSDTAAARDSLRARTADSLGATSAPPPPSSAPPALTSDLHAQARRHQR